MTTRQKKIAIVIAGAMLLVIAVVGVIELARMTLIAIAGLLVVGVVLFLVFKIRAKRKTKTVFGFTLLLRRAVDGDGSRYHFEVAEVIKNGERVVRSMRDAPPLSRFALGALYYSIDDHNAAVEQLALAAEEEVLKDSRHVLPSRQLRRYVRRLRQIEKRPKRYAKINAAMASLTTMHRERGARLLAESQQQLKRMVEAYENELSDHIRAPRRDLRISTQRSLKSITAPPTISEVLHDIYQENPEAS